MSTKIVKCNKATRTCRDENSTYGKCPHGIYHVPFREGVEAPKICTVSDRCVTPPGGGHGCKSGTKVRCVPKS